MVNYIKLKKKVFSVFNLPHYYCAFMYWETCGFIEWMRKHPQLFFAIAKFIVVVFWKKLKTRNMAYYTLLLSGN